MRDFPSCFGEIGVQVADVSCSSGNVSKASQDMVTSIYQCNLVGKYCLVTITWTKNMLGQCVSVEIANSSNQFVCRLDVTPFLFFKRKGYKYIDLNSVKIGMYWDLSRVKFGSGPEPVEGFYVGVVCNGEMVILVGDLKKEAFKKSNATPCFDKTKFISKREHIFGKKVYSTKAQISDNGPTHDLKIEFDSLGDEDSVLVICVDGKILMEVKHLRWKFRGNNTILVDDCHVDVFWDVHDWLFGTAFGSAVFMFQTCLAAEKMSSGQPFLDSDIKHWQCSEELNSPALRSSLTLFDWKNE